MSFRCRFGLVALWGVAAAIALAPLRVSADTPLPPPLQGSIIAALDALPEQCPAPGSITTLASANPDLAAEIADFAAQQMRAEPREADDSHCACVKEMATALTPASPEHAPDIRAAFTGRFPECGTDVTAALEKTLSEPAAGGRPVRDWPGSQNIPGFGIFGEPTKKCSDVCLTAEPPKTDAASHTTF